MKMKTLFVILGLAFAASPARAADLQSWADEATHKVYFVTRPEVKVALTSVGADEDDWDLVSVDVDSSNPKMDNYFARLKQRFPGYTLLRLIIDAPGDFR